MLLIKALGQGQILYFPQMILVTSIERAVDAGRRCFWKQEKRHTVDT